MQKLSQFMQTRYGADYPSDLKPAIVINNYENAEYILAHADTFPSADLEAIEILAMELLPYYTLAKNGFPL